VNFGRAIGIWSAEAQFPPDAEASASALQKRLLLSPAGRARGDYGVRKRSFRPMLKLTLQHSKNGYSPLPRYGRRAGGEGESIDAYPTSSSLRPSSLPSSTSQARSGWGIIPSTLNPAFATPAICSIEPFGLYAASNSPVGLQ
jgi:hypothetical protein